jgi:hypothetical protein
MTPGSTIKNKNKTIRRLNRHIRHCEEIIRKLENRKVDVISLMFGFSAGSAISFIIAGFLL